MFRPAYLELLASGVLDERVDAACTCRSSTTPAGYDSLEALALLDGVVDLYMPDMKYADSAIAHRYSHVRDYWEVNRAAVKEMHRQVGDLVLDDQGIAQRGLLVRHLVLPGDLAGTEHVVELLAHEISRARNSTTRSVPARSPGKTRWRTSRPRCAMPRSSSTRSPTWRCISFTAARFTSQ